MAISADSIRLRYIFSLGDTAEYAPRQTFHSRADSLDWQRSRRAAESARGLHISISLFERRLRVLRDADTLLVAPIAVASGLTLDFAGRSWTFRTPRGRHSVIAKVTDPVWRPPEWLYAEAALEHGLQLARLTSEGADVGRGRRLTIRHGLAGLITQPSGRFVPLPIDEHIVFNNTLYVPPLGTHNRRVLGALGDFALDLGDGYLIHGTPIPSSIGRAVTHGCIRLGDADLVWVYDNVPLGTAVHVY
ncbi:MAG: L,D-transpeptidase [Gemmatimonadaceae bacterium]